MQIPELSFKDIKNSNKNYVILRLGSVYGYSLDTMRLNIMPNLFSKIASQDGTIKLFSGGKQIKSLVPLMDVVRCMKFMEENEKIKAVYKTYEIPLSKRQKALQRVRERMQQLEKEIEDIKKKKIADAKSRVLRKQQFQKMGRKSRENFRKEQFISKNKFKF